MCDKADTEKATWNKCFFRRDLKVETVSEVRMSSGREFQRLGADRMKALDPMVVRLADGVKSWMVEEDRRVREDVWIWISSARYEGPRL